LQKDANIIKGIILIAKFGAKVLFYTGATHSFVSAQFTNLSDVTPIPLGYILEVITPSSGSSIARTYLPKVEVIISGQNLPANLILLDMVGYDVILDIDWMYEYCACMICHERCIQFTRTDQHALEYKASKNKVLWFTMIHRVLDWDAC
jgi:hypothetical protein